MNENPTTTSDKSIKTKKSYNWLGVSGIIILMLIALVGLGFSAYSWKHNRSLASTIDANNTQIQDLNNKVSSLTVSVSNAQKVTATTSNKVVAIKELGIKLTVPDSLNDLTYSYTSATVKDGATSTKIENANLSTKTITDLFQDNVCSSQTAALGVLSRQDGQFKAVYSVTLVKQFPTFYIAYSTPQEYCSQKQIDTRQQTVTQSLADLKSALASVEQL